MSQSAMHSKAFTAGEDLAPYRFVKLNGTTAGEVVYADAADALDVIGIVQAPGIETTAAGATASGSQVAVHFLGSRTVKCTASEALTMHELVKFANDGKIQDAGATANEVVIGRTLEAASGDGSIVEVALFPAIQDRDLS